MPSAGEPPDDDEARESLHERVEPEGDERDRAGRDSRRHTHDALDAHPDQAQPREQAGAARGFGHRGGQFALPCSRERVDQQPLEVRDEALRLGEQAAAGEQPRTHASLDPLHEHTVLGADLVVEGEQVGDPFLVDGRDTK